MSIKPEKQKIIAIEKNRAIVGTLLIFSLLVSAFFVRRWVDLLIVAIYLVVAIISYTSGIIWLTRPNENRFQESESAIESRRLLIGLHITLFLWTIGLWGSWFFRSNSKDLITFFITHFIVSIGAGMAISHLIWVDLKRSSLENEE